MATKKSAAAEKTPVVAAKTPTNNSGIEKGKFDKQLRSSYSGFLGTDTNHVLYAGYFTKGSVIEIEIEVPADKSFKFKKDNTFLWYLNDSVYESSMERLLSGPQLKIDDSSTDDHITGRMSTTSASQMILTTIPYDAGWNVYVDGQKVEIYETLDALMAFDIESTGDHTIEFRYMPSCYKIGFAISIISIFVFIVLCVLEFVLKKKQVVKVKNCPDEYWVLDDFDEDVELAKQAEEEEVQKLLAECAENEHAESEANSDTQIENTAAKNTETDNVTDTQETELRSDDTLSEKPNDSSDDTVSND